MNVNCRLTHPTIGGAVGGMSSLGGMPPDINCARTSIVEEHLAALHAACDGLDKVLSEHISRLASALRRQPETDHKDVGRPYPAGECPLSDRILGAKCRLEDLAENLQKVTERVCL